MKKSLFFLLLSSLLVLSSCSSDDDDTNPISNNPLVGKWECLNKHGVVDVTPSDIKESLEKEFTVPGYYDGDSEIMELRADGTGTEVYTDVYNGETEINSANFTYTLSGNKLTKIFKDREEEQEEVFTVTLVGDKLVLEQDITEEEKDYYETRYPGYLLTKYVVQINYNKIN